MHYTHVGNDDNNQQMMTSLEIAELTGKQHKNVMQAIRNMEPAWVKVNGLKFQLVEYRDQKSELRPCYQLTKTECLYIATKFNDEARTKYSRELGSKAYLCVRKIKNTGLFKPYAIIDQAMFDAEVSVLQKKEPLV